MSETVEVKAPNAFADNEKLTDLFHGIADHLSLWHWLYGLRYDEIRTGPLVWAHRNLLMFRIWTNVDGRPISMSRYDPRMPNLPKVWKNRIFRMRHFVNMNGWYRRRALDVEHEINNWAAERHLTPKDMDATCRWTSEGVIVIKLVDKRKPMNADTHMIHKRYD